MRSRKRDMETNIKGVEMQKKEQRNIETEKERYMKTNQKEA